MLYRLRVENIALIDSLEIEFCQGLNVLSGETGAGKSIIVDAVNLALGERADRELIRHGKASAFVEAVFDLGDVDIDELLDQFGLPKDDLLIITREMFAEGKNVCRINGRTVTLSALKEITASMVDMHGQHDHQELLNASYQLQVLDAFAEHEIMPLKEKISNLYHRLREVKKELDAIYGDDAQREQRMDILTYQINEIENAHLEEEEEEQLTDRKRAILNFEKIKHALNTAGELILGDRQAAEAVDQAQCALSKVSEYHEEVSDLYDRLNTAYYELRDIGECLNGISEDLDFNENELNEIEERLELIHKLCRKYGGSVEKVNAFCEEATEELDRLQNSERRIAELRTEKEKLEHKLYALSEELSNARRQQAQQMAEKMVVQLQELGMNARFEVSFRDLPDRDGEVHYTANGLDQVCYLFSANKGEELKPLSKIISGGEMSRFMLAVKTVMAKLMGVSTMIFDEIDTGISGNMAHAVARKMGVIAVDRQVICVTHLPQIAAMADANYLIKKIEVDEKTNTTVRRLAEEGVAEEVSRLSGGHLSASSMEHAHSLLIEAQEFKKQIKNA